VLRLISIVMDRLECSIAFVAIWRKDLLSSTLLLRTRAREARRR
jgi:hypothetical protein